MAHEYFDDPYGSFRLRIINQFSQPQDNSFRQNVLPTLRDIIHQSNRNRNPSPPHQYHREYSHSNRHSNSSNDRPHRRYRLEAPNYYSYVRHPRGSDHQPNFPHDLLRDFFGARDGSSLGNSVFVNPTNLRLQFVNLSDLLDYSDETPSVGLSNNDIEHMPTMTYRKSKTKDDKCAICLSEYKNDETVKRLRCEHLFHAECIDPWLKTSSQCPICRGTQVD
ncbi:unnamed protein product [Adineta steineri]|uniref:RING-type E3 ubiquitin transferase n=1 Tax=Adineta steineri TaxID=433720 RepID=A0A814P084_9BILA|nr:unnamed protein product [Adineta steineri]CAF0839202.1 unnamed protein product [Adineta steineri]CAF1100574.1 unnamed protein product [Adineta steineri]CAF3800046.1 unnamed protein product [Adineta steineri]CAF3850695.1 unnamed protein product [Adineta steineri]